MKRTPVATRKRRSRRLAETSHDPSPANHQETQHPISRDLSAFEYSLIVGSAAFARWDALREEGHTVVALVPG
jgi:hypothetical protein